MEEKLDKELKNTALDWAEKVFKNMHDALTDPTKGMTPDIAKMYNELTEWGWFNMFDIKDKTLTKMFITLLAMPRYKQLVHNKLHPPVSKWQKVTGRGLKLK